MSFVPVALVVLVTSQLVYSENESFVASTQSGKKDFVPFIRNVNALRSTTVVTIDVYNENTELVVRNETLPEPPNVKIQCPSICLPYVMGAFCKGVIIGNTKCRSGFCCDMTRRPVSATRETTIVMATTPTTIPTTTPTKILETGSLLAVFFMDFEKAIMSHRPNESSGCPGTCVESSLIESCVSYLNKSDLCSEGSLCCIKDTNEKKTNLILQIEKDGVTIPETEQTTIKLPLLERQCKGGCVFGSSIILCSNLDTNAACPSYGLCCLSKNKLMTTRPPTTIAYQQQESEKTTLEPTTMNTDPTTTTSTNNNDNH